MFVAFDILWANGRDVRSRNLLARKEIVARIVPASSSCILMAQHVANDGTALFAAACRRDLEGVVAKHSRSPYAVVGGRSPWVKVTKRAYSQAMDRWERFAPRNGGSIGNRSKASALPRSSA